MEVKDSDKPKTCIFCNQSEDNELHYGKFYELDGDIVTHYYCLLLSSNMEQNGGDSDGILGFLREDILKELRRGKRLTCSYCRSTGATLGCCVARCKKVFHFPCGRRAGSLHQFFGQFKSFCASHRPLQKIDANILQQSRKKEATCPICYDDVDPMASKTSLWAPCCRVNAWFHRDCVQKLAMSAGYFFKCPLCNNKATFQKAMLDFGIYIPEQDASWELVPNAYQELLHRHKRCDATRCHCPKGRTHEMTGTRWELVLCKFCGSQGVHIGCGQLRWSNPEWECDECKVMLQQAHEHPASDCEGEQQEETPTVSGTAVETRPAVSRRNRRIGRRRIGRRLRNVIENSSAAIVEESSSSRTSSPITGPVSPPTPVAVVELSDDDDVVEILDDNSIVNITNKNMNSGPVVLTSDGKAIPVVQVPSIPLIPEGEDFCVVGDLNVKMPVPQQTTSTTLHPQPTRTLVSNSKPRSAVINNVKLPNNTINNNNSNVPRSQTASVNSFRPLTQLCDDKPKPAGLLKVTYSNTPIDGDQPVKRIRVSDPIPVSNAVSGNMLKTYLSDASQNLQSKQQTVNHVKNQQPQSVKQSGLNQQKQILTQTEMVRMNKQQQSITQSRIITNKNQQTGMVVMQQQQDVNQSGMIMVSQQQQVVDQSGMVMMPQQSTPQTSVLRGQTLAQPTLMMMMPQQQLAQPVRGQSVMNQPTMMMVQQPPAMCVSSHPNSRWSLPQAAQPQYMVGFVPQQLYQVQPYVQSNFVPIQPRPPVLLQPVHNNVIDLTETENCHEQRNDGRHSDNRVIPSNLSLSDLRFKLINANTLQMVLCDNFAIRFGIVTSHYKNSGSDHSSQNTSPLDKDIVATQSGRSNKRSPKRRNRVPMEYRVYKRKRRNFFCRNKRPLSSCQRERSPSISRSYTDTLSRGRSRTSTRHGHVQSKLENINSLTSLNGRKCPSYSQQINKFLPPAKNEASCSKKEQNSECRTGISESRTAMSISSSSSGSSKFRKTNHIPELRNTRSRGVYQLKHTRSRSVPWLGNTRSRSMSQSRNTRSRSVSPSEHRRSRSASPSKHRRSRSASPSKHRRSRSASPSKHRRSRSASPSKHRRSRSVSPSEHRRSRSAYPSKHRRSRSAYPSKHRRSRSMSPSEHRRSRSVSPSEHRKSRSAYPSKHRRSRSMSPSEHRRSRNVSPSEHRRSRSVSPSEHRKSRSAYPSKHRRSRSMSPSEHRRSRNVSPSEHRRSRSVSPSEHRRSRNASPSERRRSRNASPSKHRKSRSMSPSEHRRSRSVSPSEHKRSRNASPSKHTRSRSVHRLKNTRSRSMSQSRNSRSRSVSQLKHTGSRNVPQLRNTRSRSVSQLKHTGSRNVPQLRNTRSRSMSQSRNTRSRSVSQSRNTRSRSVSQLKHTGSRNVPQLRNTRSRSMSQSRNTRSRSVSQLKHTGSRSVPQLRNTRSRSVSQLKHTGSRSVPQLKHTGSRSMPQLRNTRSRSVSQLKHTGSRSVPQLKHTGSRSMPQLRNTRSRSVSQLRNTRSTSMSHLRNVSSRSVSSSRSRSMPLSRNRRKVLKNESITGASTASTSSSTSRLSIPDAVSRNKRVETSRNKRARSLSVSMNKRLRSASAPRISSGNTRKENKKKRNRIDSGRSAKDGKLDKSEEFHTPSSKRARKKSGSWMFDTIDISLHTTVLTRSRRERKLRSLKGRKRAFSNIITNPKPSVEVLFQRRNKRSRSVSGDLRNIPTSNQKISNTCAAKSVNESSEKLKVQNDRTSISSDVNGAVSSTTLDISNSTDTSRSSNRQRSKSESSTMYVRSVVTRSQSKPVLRSKRVMNRSPSFEYPQLTPHSRTLNNTKNRQTRKSLLQSHSPRSQKTVVEEENQKESLTKQTRLESVRLQTSLKSQKSVIENEVQNKTFSEETNIEPVRSQMSVLKKEVSTSHKFGGRVRSKSESKSFDCRSQQLSCSNVNAVSEQLKFQNGVRMMPCNSTLVKQRIGEKVQNPRTRRYSWSSETGITSFEEISLSQKNNTVQYVTNTGIGLNRTIEINNSIKDKQEYSDVATNNTVKSHEASSFCVDVKRILNDLNERQTEDYIVRMKAKALAARKFRPTSRTEDLQRKMMKELQSLYRSEKS